VGEEQRARTLGQETLKRCRRVLGTDHPITLRAASVLMQALNEPAEVEPTRAG
jgi:hypothetical protein